MRSHSEVHDDRALTAFPGVRLLGYRQAVEQSLEKLHPARLEPVWRASRAPVTIFKHEGFFIDHRRLLVKAPPPQVFQVISGLGGRRGWLYANWLWKLRGRFDHLLGGPGLRGRASSSQQVTPVGEGNGLGVRVGDTIDFYRVQAVENARALLLKAELKVPGEGWMEWRVEKEPDGATLLTQTAFFTPRGLPGFTYWYLLAPFHRLVFRGLIRAIAHQSHV